MVSLMRRPDLRLFLCATAAIWAVGKGSVGVAATEVADDHSQGWRTQHEPTQPKMDTALLVFVDKSTVERNGSLVLLGQTSECYRCEFLVLVNLTDEQGRTQPNRSVLVWTDFPVTLHLVEHLENNTERSICSYQDYWFLDGGIYTLFLKRNASSLASRAPYELECTMTNSNEPSDNRIPILVAAIVLLIISAAVYLVSFLYNSGRLDPILVRLSADKVVENDLGIMHGTRYGSISSKAPLPTNPGSEERIVTGSPRASSSSASGRQSMSASGGQRSSNLALAGSPVTGRRRLHSLDAFRGLCLAVMIFVNYGGGGYWFFKHSSWNGLTVADLVFPWFVFIMGTAIAITLNSLVLKQSRVQILFKVFRRALTLFFIGLALNSSGHNDWAKLRIPGVLQRLAVSYLVVASIHLWFARLDDRWQYTRYARHIRDVIYYWPQWAIHLILLSVYISVSYFVGAPNCPIGYAGPGGLADQGKYPNCTGGIAGYIDRVVFGEAHIYQHPTCKEIYQTTVPYDPEGLLGNLTSVFLCFLGLQSGIILHTYKDYRQQLVRFGVWSLVLGAVGAGLTQLEKDSGLVPINKNLWSVTFILSLGSMAYCLLALFYVLCDVYQVWSGAPFIYPGMNSIVIYVCSEVFPHYIPVSWRLDQVHGAQLAINLWSTSFWLFISFVLYKKKIFLAI